MVTLSRLVAKTHIVSFRRNAKLVWLSIFADLGGVTSMATSGREDGKRRDFLLGKKKYLQFVSICAGGQRMWFDFTKCHGE